MEKIKQNKFVSFINQKMNMRVFWILVFGIVAFIVIISVCFSSLDTDMFFMLAAGDEILDNGIPYTNVWSIDKSAGIVIQQWLYCVIVSLFNKMGVFGLFLLSLITIIIFVVATKIFFNVKECKNNGAFFLYLCITFAFSAYLFSIRPETVTLVVLFMECCGLEMFKKTGHKRWLWLLPVTMLLEINLHSSMWPLHYAILLAYFVPSLNHHLMNDSSLFKQKKDLILPTLAMTGVMFCNPYGVDNILYIVRSIKMGVFDILNIQECKAPTYFSCTTATILMFIAMSFVLVKCKKMDSVTMYLTLGIAVMTMSKVRHNMFNCIPFAYLCIGLYDAYISQDKVVIDWQKDIKRYLYALFAVAYMFLFIVFVGLLDSTLGTKDAYTVLRNGDVKEISQALNKFNYDDDLVLIIEYLSENDCYHNTIFTGFNTGGYLECLGYDNIFIDARPEIYHHSVNKSNDIAMEYIDLMIPSALTQDFDALSKESTDYRDFLTKFTNKYQFDYVLVDARTNEASYGMYLETRSDYEFMEDVSTKSFYLYKKVK